MREGWQLCIAINNLQFLLNFLGNIRQANERLMDYLVFTCLFENEISDCIFKMTSLQIMPEEMADNS